MTDSWRLKLNRAQKHLRDLHSEAQVYSNTHPYEILRVVRPNAGKETWVYRVQITDQPNEGIVLILGDFIHNLRSALDHLVFACLPTVNRNQAAFPIAFVDPWKRSGRQFVIRDPDVRKRFLRQIRGINPRARALIEQLQPYKAAVPDTATLGLIGRLDNADKHRRLILIGTAIEDPVLTRVWPDGGVTQDSYPTRGRHYFDDGSDLFTVDDLSEWLRGWPDVQVQSSATAVISIQMPGDGRGRANYRLLDTTERMFVEVSNVASLLEPFVMR